MTLKAYAEIIGLPPIYGLYTSFVPPLVYCFFGTSRELNVGPTSVISIFTASIFSGKNLTQVWRTTWCNFLLVGAVDKSSDFIDFSLWFIYSFVWTFASWIHS